MGRTISAAELSRIVAELDSGLRGAPVQDARQPSPLDLYIELRIPGETHILLISASIGFSRMHLASARPMNPETPYNFQSLLRARLAGRMLESVSQINADRAAILRFSGGMSLVAELTGRHANVFLCEGGGMAIAGSIRPSVSKKRALFPGRPYQPPLPRPGGIDMPGAEGPELPGPFAFNRHLDSIYSPLVAGSEAESARERAAALIAAEEKRQKRLLEKVQGDLRASQRAPEYVRFGEALKHNLDMVKKGETTASIPEYRAEGVGKIEIKLRADLSPIENMERYFHLSRRLSAARSRIALKIEKVKARLSELESLGGRVAEAGEPERMSRLLEKAKIPGARGAPRPPQTPAEGRAAFKEYFIPGAGRILAGGSAEENDELTFRTARGNDLWFHVAGFPGAHVVAPMPRGREPSPELIRTCALIAASRSRAPEGEKVEVAWCRQKHLRKPRGAARGAVLMSQEKRLLVEVKKGAFAEYLIL